MTAAASRGRGALADADGVVGGIEVCWLGNRRGVRVLLTDRLEHYRSVLSRALGADRVAIRVLRRRP
jgi:hypothetical protein